MRSPLLVAIQWMKRILLRGGRRYRRIRFGIARGMEMPIDRHSELRCELGLFEPGLVRDFREMARNARVGYDIGSHLGYYALAMIRQGIQTVYAFEPRPQLAAMLRATLDRNGCNGVMVRTEAVTARSGEGSIAIDDAVGFGELLPPDFIKMDIDGGEAEALKGMRTTLIEHHPRLIVEIHSIALEDRCHEILRELGYSTRVLDAPRWQRVLIPEVRYIEGHIELNRWLATE